MPAVAQRLGQRHRRCVHAKVQTLDGQPGPGSLPSLPAYIFQRADLPTARSRPGCSATRCLAGVLRPARVRRLVFLLDYLDLTIKTMTEAENRLQLPVLGFIPYNADHTTPRLHRVRTADESDADRTELAS